MRFVAEEIPAFIKAKTHHGKAAELDAPHAVFLERYLGLEFLFRDVAPQAQKHDAFVFAREASEADVLTACLAQLSRPRIDAILRLEAIPALNVVLSRKNMQTLIGRNELLQDLGLGVPDWLNARKDLRFALKSNTQKALKAVATLLLIVRAGCDPKVKKQDSLVKDIAVLEPANALLKDCVIQLIEHYQKAADRFHQPDFRNLARKV